MTKEQIESYLSIGLQGSESECEIHEQDGGTLIVVTKRIVYENSLQIELGCPSATAVVMLDQLIESVKKSTAG